MWHKQLGEWWSYGNNGFERDGAKAKAHALKNVCDIETKQQDAARRLSQLTLSTADAGEALIQIRDSGPYDALCITGVARHAEKRYAKAAKVLRKAIALQPENPEAHLYLAQTLLRSADQVGASKSILRAEELARAHAYQQVGLDGSAKHIALTESQALFFWAKATCLAFNLLIGMGEDADDLRPSWYNDAELLARSKLVIDMVKMTERSKDATDADSAHHHIAWQMRADVLSGPVHDNKWIGWQPRQRSLEQLREAARCYRRAARCPHGEFDVTCSERGYAADMMSRASTVKGMADQLAAAGSTEMEFVPYEERRPGDPEPSVGGALHVRIGSDEADQLQQVCDTMIEKHAACGGGQ